MFTSLSENWRVIILLWMICYYSLQGKDIFKQKSPFMACSIATSRLCGHSSIPYVSNQQVRSLSCANKYKIRHSPFVSRNFIQGSSLLTSSVRCWRGLYFSNHRPGHSARWRIYATLDVASAVDVINDLGFDTLTFLAVTVMIVPAFKIIKASPVRVLWYWPFYFWCVNSSSSSLGNMGKHLGREWVFIHCWVVLQICIPWFNLLIHA